MHWAGTPTRTFTWKRCFLLAPGSIARAGPAPPWRLCSTAGPHGSEFALPWQCLRIQHVLSFRGPVIEMVSYNLANRDSTQHFSGLVDCRLQIGSDASYSKRTSSRADKAGELDARGMGAVADADGHVIGETLAISDQRAEKTGWRGCTMHDGSARSLGRVSSFKTCFRLYSFRTPHGETSNEKAPRFPDGASCTTWADASDRLDLGSGRTLLADTSHIAHFLSFLK
ncbi:hypothetical protein LMG26411_01455 [Cupriavidus numazuensis]|uniref:Uncharacterized protein n=1 Tax=Cupriavidus numazuensis TaxID=221992 RepID=A0ABN7PTS4_9BURK|nr:hypothetical protein LMG26411_01455 [Cupriavidus numazuensis]